MQIELKLLLSEGLRDFITIFLTLRKKLYTKFASRLQRVVFLYQFAFSQSHFLFNVLYESWIQHKLFSSRNFKARSKHSEKNGCNRFLLTLLMGYRVCCLKSGLATLWSKIKSTTLGQCDNQAFKFQILQNIFTSSNSCSNIHIHHARCGLELN